MDRLISCVLLQPLDSRAATYLWQISLMYCSRIPTMFPTAQVPTHLERIHWLNKPIDVSGTVPTDGDG